MKRCRHTVEDKRKLRNARKCRKRQEKTNAVTKCEAEKDELKKELAEEIEAHEATKKRNIVGRNMARSFWERWRYEHGEHKEALKELCFSKGVVEVPKFPVFDRSLLCDPKESGKSPDNSDVFFVGRGSFGIVRCQMYRGIYVAVKEFLPRTLKDSVVKEAQVMSGLCHPYLPFLLGVCTSKYPYILVTQYYGIGLKSVTFQSELREPGYILTSRTWVILCAQLVSTLKYLHIEASTLHNDLKGDNILITTIKQTGKESVFIDPHFQIVVIDFGKATAKDNGKKLSLSFSEKQQYRLYHSHLAPELIDGLVRQSSFTDIYSLGKLFLKVSTALQKRDAEDCKLSEVAEMCSNSNFSERPTALELEKLFEHHLKK